MKALMQWKLLLLGICFLFTNPVAKGQVVPDSSFSSAVNDWVYAIAQHMDAKILVGGKFTTIGGTAQEYIARLNLDGTVETSFSPVLNGPVRVITVQLDGKILIGGEFITIDGMAHQRIARLNSDGSLDSSFIASANGSVSSIIPQTDGKILLSGYFTQVCGQPRHGFARLHADGTLDASFNTLISPGQRHAMTLLSDGKIVTNTLDRITRITSIVRLDSDGSLDSSFVYPAGSSLTTIEAIIEQTDGKIIVGGYRLASNLIRLNPDGTVDNSFNPSPNLWVNTLALQADGKILVGGAFDNIGGFDIPNLARLNADGSVDTTFTPGANEGISGITIQSDGRILTVGGAYWQALGRIARWLNDPTESGLEISPSGQIDWFPSGNMQLFTQTWMEIWQDGQWVALGEASRTSTGWRLTEVSLPETGLLRVLGRATSGYSNGGSGIVSVMLPYSGGGISLNYDNWPVLPDLLPGRRGALDTNGAMDLPNILVYAMGLHPYNAKSSDMPKVSIVDHDPSRISFQFRRNTASQDVALSIWKSSTLTPDSWSPVVALGETISDSGQGWESVMTEVEKSVDGRDFFRLKADFVE